MRSPICDFGCAALESWNGGQLGCTTQYVSPFRTLMRDAPLAKADDLYATGITMWQLYTGREPFDDVDPEFLEDVIASGFQPNLLAVLCRRHHHPRADSFLSGRGKSAFARRPLLPKQ